jgi:arsenate reductase
MAEALLRERGDRFEAHSAGTEAGQVRPLTMRVLEEAGLPTGELRSKSVAEFLDQKFDYVITVCDQAKEACPVFPGATSSLHWSIDDPTQVTGTDAERLEAFRTAFRSIEERIKEFAD